MLDGIQYILLTIDVEDWFQVENFKPWIPFSTWDSYELRVEHNVHRLLDLFDSVKLKNQAAQSSNLKAQKTDDRSQKSEVRRPKTESDGDQMMDHGKQPSSLQASKLQAADYELSATSYEKSHPKATFFILAWIAEKLPQLIREIHSRGHEVASHGCNHQLSNQLSNEALTTDLGDSKKILEDIIGASVNGFRSPSFSINSHVLGKIAECGYLYDSSFNSFRMHNRYGQIELSANSKKGIVLKISDTFFELPLSNLKLMGKILPWGGGAYFRLIPHRLFRRGVQSILKCEGAYVFYMHPWEIDSGQPRVREASANFKFRHYSNLSKTYDRLARLIESFQQYHFVTCIDYLQNVTKTNLRGSTDM